MMGFGFLGVILLFVLGGLLVGGIPALGRGFSSNSGTRTLDAGSAPNARDILDQRYARGEIGRDEYQRAKQDLADS
jgi:putative membrane protein